MKTNEEVILEYDFQRTCNVNWTGDIAATGIELKEISGDEFDKIFDTQKYSKETIKEECKEFNKMGKGIPAAVLNPKIRSLILNELEKQNNFGRIQFENGKTMEWNSRISMGINMNEVWFQEVPNIELRVAKELLDKTDYEGIMSYTDNVHVTGKMTPIVVDTYDPNYLSTSIQLEFKGEGLSAKEQVFADYTINQDGDGVIDFHQYGLTHERELSPFVQNNLDVLCNELDYRFEEKRGLIDKNAVKAWQPSNTKEKAEEQER